MNRYIRCCYCGCILGEIQDFEELPTSAYCVSCFAQRKTEALEREISDEILQEWER